MESNSSIHDLGFKPAEAVVMVGAKPIFWDTDQEWDC